MEANNKYFYFDDENGQMKTGKMTVYSDEFYNEIFYFATTGSVGERGAGVSGVKDGYLYENGLLVKAEDGMKYALEEVAGKEYVVSESGKVKTSGSVKDADGVKYSVSGGVASVTGYNGADKIVSISPTYTPEGETTSYPVKKITGISSDVITTSPSHKLFFPYVRATKFNDSLTFLVNTTSSKLALINFATFSRAISYSLVAL